MRNVAGDMIKTQYIENQIQSHAEIFIEVEHEQLVEVGKGSPRKGVKPIIGQSTVGTVS
jgi:hypothetical protein